MYAMRVFCSAAQAHPRMRCPQSLKRYSGAMTTSVDSHHAPKAIKRTTDAQAASGSVDAHHAADATKETSVAVMSYNVGINNTELGRTWKLPKGKYRRLRDDIESIFAHETSIEILLRSEFGSMASSVDVPLSYGVEQPIGDTLPRGYKVTSPSRIRK